MSVVTNVKIKVEIEEENTKEEEEEYNINKKPTVTKDEEAKDHGNLFIDIKMEPMEEDADNCDEETPLAVENVMVTVKKESDCCENVKVKKEPDYCENVNNDNSQDRNCRSPDSILPDSENMANVVKVECDQEPSSPLRSEETDKDYSDDEEDSEDDYEPEPVKKKRKYTVNRTSNVKPTYSLKKASKYKFSDEVLSKIEIVTITEEERQIEFEQVAASRSRFKYICAQCTQGFATQDAYLVHLKVHSPEQGPYQCEICHYRYRTEIGLHHHRLRHFRRYRCATCHAEGTTKQFRDRETAACHVMTLHEKSLWDCHLCGKGFRRPQYLKIHINQMHTKTDNFQCKICDRVFHEKAVYRCHIRKHNEEIKPSYDGPLRCESCQKDFKTFFSYNKHKEVHAKRRTCNICGECCKNKEAYERHLRSKHGYTLEESSGHACAHCPRVLVSHSMLQRHVRRMHTERTKDFQCDYCKRFYYSKGEVRTHIMWSHLSVTRHACACGRVFRNPSRYRCHVARAHEGKPPAKDHVCDVCQKGFPSRQQLTRHMSVHSDQTYPCSECDATFKSRDYVKIHYKIKHLNMTRAQINAMKKPKKPKTMDDGFKITNDSKTFDTKTTEPKPFCEVRIKQEIEEVNEGISVPLFETFLDVVRD